MKRPAFSPALAAVLLFFVSQWSYPGDLTGGEKAGDDSGAAVTLPKSLNLAAARDLTLQHNRLIAQAKERIREQEGVIVETNAAHYPRVDA
ncbi:MAG: hypothetical protein KDL87_18600, partial [Verrucomicrobiae bacterium]|nr:hypothetical protein [Verrucomicrobiae bacterium]